MRAYLRLWDLLQRMDGAFEDALATERDRRDPTDGHDGQDGDEGWASDDAAYRGDPYLGELRQEERNRVDFERQIDHEVEQRVQDDVRYPGRGEVLDRHAWTRRIDHLAERRRHRLPRPPDPRAPHDPLDGVDTSHIRPTIIVDV
ncbi:hypothetical protein ACFPOI_50840 [Nonomuraea angiospora]|uniref:Uncharacterized protein n=1 Tax=Nonomuraea angiospora TaxID=46172 RepID=A0ABR9M173_9ACTN|nr:hypothetical protein [Nonomuraea angiospora]MBE1586654.1 hypothetical protein [Nonomuraea angiospora]